MFTKYITAAKSVEITLKRASMEIRSNYTQVIIASSLLMEEKVCVFGGWGVAAGRGGARKKRKLNVFPTRQGKSASGVHMHFLTDPRPVSLLGTMRSLDHLYLLESRHELSGES